MVRVGVVGLGMMGLTHIDAYLRREDVQLVAICDSDPERLSGKTKAIGNVEGHAQTGVDELDVQRLSDIHDLIGNTDIDLVDICLPTDMHVRFGLEVLKAGQHLMVEKPLARTSDDARRLMEAAEDAKGMTMVGHCMRFWPGWTWLKEVIDEQRYGKLYSLSFRRLVNHPGGPFYLDGDRSGGAALDLHVHDTDFVHFCLGMPTAVTSFGYSKLTNQPDHISTFYHYDDVPLVRAEGSWAMADGFAFNMSFLANFESATAVYDSSLPDPLRLCKDGQAEVVPVDNKMGYDLELDYLIDCIAAGRHPQRVTLKDAYHTIRIIEAEVSSCRQRKTVRVE